MARPTRRADEASPTDLHELGVRGRKTGATLRDRGERDEYGMQPLDDIFSSPGADATQKVSPAPAPEAAPEPAPAPKPTQIPEATPDRGGNDSGSDEMEIASSAGPGPQTVLRKSRLSYGLPKSRSPVKTNAKSLRSPAKRNPALPPSRKSLTPTDTSTARRIDFHNRPSLSSGPRRPAGIGEIPSDDSNSIHGGDGDMDIDAMVDQSMQMVDAMRTDPADPDYQSINEYRPRIASPRATAGMSEKAKGKQKAIPNTSPLQPAPPRRPSPRQIPEDEPEESLYVPEGPGPSPSPEPAPLQHSSPPAPLHDLSITRPSPRPPAQNRPAPATSKAASTGRHVRDDTEEDRRDQAKRQRQTESVTSRRSEQPVKRGRGRPPKNGAVKRGRGRPRKSSVETDGEEGESLMTLQRGPPMPKSRGLVSMRRDNTAGAESRRSYNDADWWADIPDNDASYEAERPRDHPPATAQTTTTKLRRGPGAAAAVADDVDLELEDWELDPGTVTGEIVLWEPEHEENPPGPDDPVQVTDERIAITADAIQTYEIRDSDARYAKPLTMPFMGAGLVDLPPGAEKRPKNSRKMHLVFFVHFGKVTVSINDVQFRISAGGMWFVPRGNYYNIANDYDFPARVYFAQACEVSPSAMEEMTQHSMAA